MKTALEALRISERTQEQLKQLATEEQETPVHGLEMDPQSKKHKPSSSRRKLRTTLNTASYQYCGGSIQEIVPAVQHMENLQPTVLKICKIILLAKRRQLATNAIIILGCILLYYCDMKR